jgi:zinc protease
MLHFGNEESLNGKYGLTFIGSLMMRGTKNFNRQQIQEELDKLKSTMSVATGQGSVSVSWETKRDQHADLLKLMEEVLRRPTFPEAELDEMKQLRKQAIEKSMTDPSGVAFNALSRKLNPHPKTSIHYVPTFEESLERLANVSRASVVKLYEEQIGATSGELVIVGDFDPDATVKQFEAMLAGWKSNIAYKRIPDVLVKGIKGSKESLNTPDKENAMYVAAFKFEMDDSAPDYAALEMGNEILGGSFTSRLLDRFRQKEGWSYGASSYLDVGARDKVAEFLIVASCKPDVMDKVDKAAFEELARIIKDGVTEEEVKVAVKSTLEEAKIGRGNDAALTGMLRRGLELNRTFMYQAELEKKIAAVTVKDVNRALADHIQSGRLVIVRAGDFSKKSAPPERK